MKHCIPVLLIFLSLGLHAQQTVTWEKVSVDTTNFQILRLDRSEDEIDLVPYLYHQSEGVHRLFTEIRDDLPVNHPHSFLFFVKNNTPDSIARLVQLYPAFIHAVNVTMVSIDSKIQVAETEPINRWTLAMAPGETIKVEFDLNELDRLNPGKVSLTLISKQASLSNDHYIHVTQSFFLGLLGFLTVFNLVIYFVTGWRVYIKYVAYIISAFLYFLFYYGFFQEAFPFARNVSVNLVSTWYSLVYVTYFYFLNEFGQYKQYSPWAYRLLNVGIINKCIQIAYETILNPFGVEFIYSVWYKNTILVAEIILMAFIIYFILKNRSVRGKIVIVASLMLIVAAILGQLDFEQTVRGTFIQLGIVAELLTFSAGLGYFMREFYIGQQEAQEALIHQLRKNDKMQKFIQEDLESIVSLRTAELEQRNRENELLLGEVHHRVKNNLQIISSLINLKAGQASSRAKEILSQLNGRIFSMGLLHEKLYNNEKLQSIRLDLYLQELGDYLLRSFQHPTPVKIVTKFEELEVSPDEALTCGLIYNELFTNSMKHAFTTGQRDKRINLSVSLSNGEITLSVSDNGERHKNTSPSGQKAFGLRFVDQLVSTKLKGTWKVDTVNGFHTTITFKHFANKHMSSGVEK